MEKIELLKNEIINSIALEFNDIEKIIYIYIRLCKFFTYDDEFYIGLKNENRINTNNKINCIEFSNIFCELLDKLNIKDIIYSKIKYGEGHQFVNIEYKGKTISFDSTLSILNGDLINSKMNLPLSINKYGKFIEETQKVYQYIESLNKKNKKIYKLIKKSNNNKIIMGLKFRINIFLINISRKKFNDNMSQISYIIKLYKKIFSKYERENNIKFDIIGSYYKDKNNNKHVKPILVFNISSNNNLTEESNDNIEYYIYDYNLGLKKTNLTEIINNFENKTFYYSYDIESNTGIEGIDLTGEDMFKYFQTNDDIFENIRK